MGISIFGSEAFIADSGNNRIQIVRQFHSPFEMVIQWARCIFLYGFSPNRICHSSSGNIIVSSLTGGFRILEYSGQILKMVDEYPPIRGICSDAEIYLSGSGFDVAGVFNQKGELLYTLDREETDSEPFPCGICKDRRGNILIADENRRIVSITSRYGTLIKQVPVGCEVRYLSVYGNKLMVASAYEVMMFTRLVK